jgi:RNA polymerase II subunit A small phosphatase-like protein
LADFLSHLTKDFYLAIWSTASEDYIDKIISEIAPKNIKFEFVWGQTRATYKRMINVDIYNYADFVEYDYIKRLKKIKSLGFRLEKTLIVDDTPHKVKENYGNAIYIKEFKGDSNDNELIFLEKYLQGLKDSENVRTIEKRNWKKDLQMIDNN